ncbi:MAG: glycerophosphodiester phosphodiesterase family protein [Cyclobacteriaceae bacterium]
MVRLLCSFIIISLHISCSSSSAEEEESRIITETDSTEFETIHDIFLDEPNGYVMAMAHRGDWKNVPENSIAGINNCVALGVDIVEIDIQRTKDNILILMHDQTLNRTTSGSGNVSDYTWNEIKLLRLKNLDGSLSSETVPSLAQALLTAKNRILVFIDKSYDHLDLVYHLLNETGTISQVLVDGIASDEQFRIDYTEIKGDMNFTPRIGVGQSIAYIDSHLSNESNRFLFPSCNLILSENEKSTELLASNRWILLSTLTSSACSEEFESTWGWAINKGVDIIITDKPKALLEYLEKGGWRE